MKPRYRITITPEGTDHWTVYHWVLKHWQHLRPIYQSVLTLGNCYGLPKEGAHAPFPFGPKPRYDFVNKVTVYD